MTRSSTKILLDEVARNASLLRHMRRIENVIEAYAIN